MTPTLENFSPHAQTSLENLYQAISVDARYGHYVRIPERICRCLVYFKVGFCIEEVAERLRSYYLFIGVVDDAIDSGEPEIGRAILKRLEAARPSFDEETGLSCAGLAAEVLKRHISPESRAAMLSKLGELYEAVLRERASETLDAYVEQRRAVGRLTAELSYLLIRPLLDGERAALLRFLERVGAVGCLVDSVIDLRADARQGLLSFSPTVGEHLRLAFVTVREGFALTLRHPRLCGLFLEAASDVLFDRLRARRKKARPSPDGAHLVGRGYEYECASRCGANHG
ncbi:MAG TPA: hypothetical protein VGB73_02525 [Pyrinomonadaceae bacterium]|jgi:hypothetical protein